MWVQILEKVKHSFPEQVKERGKAYFASGNVTIDEVGQELVKATVRGGRTYSVIILPGENVRLSCNCPSFLDWGENCKHIWAVLLELTRQLACLGGDYNGKVRVDVLQSDMPRQLLRGIEAHKTRNWRTVFPWGSFDGEEGDTLKVKHYHPFFVLDRHIVRSENLLLISMDERYLKNNREWGRARRITKKAAESYLEHDMDEKNKKAMSLAIAGMDISKDGDGEEYADHFTVPWGASKLILHALVDTGRFFYRQESWFDEKPLRLDRHEPLSFALSLEKYNDEQFIVVLSLVSDIISLKLSAFDLFVYDTPCWGIYEGVIYFVKSGASQHILQSLRNANNPVLVSIEEVPEFLETCERNLGSLMKSLQLPDGRQLEDIEGHRPKAELVLKSKGNGELFAKLRFVYMDNYTVMDNSSLPYITDFRKLCRIYRDMEEEVTFSRKLEEVGFLKEPNDASEYDWVFNNDDYDLMLPEVVEDLVTEGWSIFGMDNKPVKLTGGFSFTVTTGIDWFELDGKMEFEGNSFTLGQVLELWKKKERFIKLNDGSLGLIPWKWFQKNGFALESAIVDEERGSALRFTSAQIGMLNMVLADETSFVSDERYTRLNKKLANFEGIASVEMSKNFKGTLRPYQEKGLDWLMFLREFGFGGCLADDMGLGKTVQVLAMLQILSDRGGLSPSLVVVPTSLVYNWLEEAERFAPKLKICSYTGLKKLRESEDFTAYDFVITTYGILRREIDKLREYKFNYVILDESQAIKNPKTQVAKSVCSLNAEYRLSMTGTPIENNIGDLWSQFEFLNPSVLGKYDDFIRRFSGKQGVDLNPLKKLIHLFLLRRMKNDVDLELPPKIEQVIHCDMTADQKKLYAHIRDNIKQSLMDDMKTEKGGGGKMKVLAGLLRLRQVCCHPHLLSERFKENGKDNIDSGKFTLFQQMLVEVLDEGHKILVFSQFTSMLKIIRDWMDNEGIAYQYMDGSTRDRGEQINAFQKNENVKVFLISLKAGGVGINLTAADYIFIYDPWWNPAVEEQAIDRAHRIGQTKKVITYRFIAKNSVEDKIVDLQKTKKELVDSIVTTDRGFVKNLSMNDIKYLFS